MSKIIDNAYLSNSVVFDVNYATGSIADKSPYKAAATVTAPVTWCNTKLGYGVRMTGAGLISYADNAANRLAGSDATFIMLGKLELGVNLGRIICKRSSAGNSYEIYLDPTTKKVSIYTATSARYATAVNNKAALIAITLIDGAPFKLYTDGTFAANANNTTSISSGTTPIIIGNRWIGDLPLSQALNRITILNRALPAQDIAQLYTELMSERFPLRAYSFGSRISAPQDPPGCPSLLKTDFTTRLPDGRLADLSGNGWHGTIKPGFAAGPGMCGNSLVANSATRSYVDFGDVTPINGASKLTMIWSGFRGASNPSEIFFDKGTANNDRNEINASTTQITWNVGKAGTIYAASINDSNVNTPSFQSWVYDGYQANNADKVKVYVDSSKPAVTISANFPNTLNNTAGTSLSYGKLGWLNNFPPFTKNEYFSLYTSALTPDQVSYIYRQIASRCTFQLDLNKVPVTLANLVGPCEISGTPFKAESGTTWAITEDTSGKHWIEGVTSTRYATYMNSSQAYGTWVFDVYHKVGATKYVWLMSNITNLIGATRNSYSLNILSTNDLWFGRYNPGTSTGLMTSAAILTENTSYKFAITRNSAGEFTLYIKGGTFNAWTKITAATGSNPVTDNTYKVSNYFNFMASTLNPNYSVKYANPTFFQGVLTTDQLNTLCS